jgi:hypothetical protein
MILPVISIIPLFLILRSIFLVIWRYKPEEKFFPLVHLLIILFSGILSFCIMFLLALGSIGHSVPDDNEEMVIDWSFSSSMVAVLLGITGLLTTIFKWIVKSRQQ